MSLDASAPGPTPAPSRPRPPREPGLLIALVAIAVVLVLLLGLVLAGDFGSGGGSTSGSIGVPFSSARSSAAEATGTHGGWELLDAIGIDLPNATSSPLNLTSLANCTVTSLTGPLPSSLALPAFHGNLSSGDAPVWLMDYREAATGAEMAVAVTNGAISLAFQVSGPQCPVSNATELGSIPNNVVDSPAAVAVAADVGGYAFLAAHPTGVTVEMFLLPQLTPEGPSSGTDWQVSYSTCPMVFGSESSEPPGEMFSAAVNATTGVVVAGSEYNGTCGGVVGPPAPGIGQALQLSPPALSVGMGSAGTLASQGCTSGDYCFSFPIIVATDNVTPGDFQLELFRQADENLTAFPVVGFAILSTVGQVVVYATGTLETAWTDGVGNSSTLLGAGMTLIVDMGTSNPSTGSWSLAFTGTGPFQGSSMDFGFS